MKSPCYNAINLLVNYIVARLICVVNPLPPKPVAEIKEYRHEENVKVQPSAGRLPAVFLSYSR